MEKERIGNGYSRESSNEAPLSGVATQHVVTTSRRRKPVTKYQRYELKRLTLEEKFSVPGYKEAFERGAQHDHDKSADPFDVFREPGRFR